MFQLGDIDMPWSPRSRSKEGEQTERQIAKKRGGRAHPRSGAGKIKDDASNDDTVFEVKDANLSHSIKASDLLALFNRATRQGKDAEYVIYFKSVDITLSGRLRKGKQ